MYPADRAVFSEPALAGGVDQPAALWALRPGHPLEDHLTQAVPHQTSSALEAFTTPFSLLPGPHPPTSRRAGSKIEASGSTPHSSGREQGHGTGHVSG